MILRHIPDAYGLSGHDGWRAVDLQALRQRRVGRDIIRVRVDVERHLYGSTIDTESFRNLNQHIYPANIAAIAEVRSKDRASQLRFQPDGGCVFRRLVRFARARLIEWLLQRNTGQCGQLADHCPFRL